MANPVEVSRVQLALGQMQWTIIVLTQQVEEATQEIASLKSENAALKSTRNYTPVPVP